MPPALRPPPSRDVQKLGADQGTQENDRGTSGLHASPAAPDELRVAAVVRSLDEGQGYEADGQPAIKLFVSEANTWKESNEWPLPQTRFTPFYLHENGVLSEIEHFPYEGQTSFDDSPYGREHVRFWTPKFVEETEVMGPLLRSGSSPPRPATSSYSS
ncbi:MAG: hypothetical protein MZV63_07330 [Marinilabiliales bacterium]|nr:hypothetical protein [Marinilabiliales bacterium]